MRHPNDLQLGFKYMQRCWDYNVFEMGDRMWYLMNYTERFPHIVLQPHQLPFRSLKISLCWYRNMCMGCRKCSYLKHLLFLSGKASLEVSNLPKSCDGMPVAPGKFSEPFICCRIVNIMQVQDKVKAKTFISSPASLQLRT